MEALAEKYILLDSLLFRITTTSEKETALLAIPEIYIDRIITLYHSSLFVGHQHKYVFYPNLIHYLRSYIIGCHVCQSAHNEKPPTRQLQTQINPNYISLSRLSMDLTVMPVSNRGHKYILCIIDEVTNYLITIPIHQAKSEEIGDALIENVLTKYYIPEFMIMDQVSTFMPSL